MRAEGKGQILWGMLLEEKGIFKKGSRGCSGREEEKRGGYKSEVVWAEEGNRHGPS